jgi:hypothetical protein
VTASRTNGLQPAPPRRRTFRARPPRDTARAALLDAVASGADEHLWSAEYLRHAVRSVLDLRQTLSVTQLAADIYLAEIARGLVEGLEQLDADVESRLADVPDAEPAPPGAAALLDSTERTLP